MFKLNFIKGKYLIFPSSIKYNFLYFKALQLHFCLRFQLFFSSFQCINPCFLIFQDRPQPFCRVISIRLCPVQYFFESFIIVRSLRVILPILSRISWKLLHSLRSFLVFFNDCLNRYFSTIFQLHYESPNKAFDSCQVDRYLIYNKLV